LSTVPFIEESPVHIDDEAVDDLRARLRATRWSGGPAPGGPADGPGDWTDGVPGDYLRDLVRYWAEDFDWREQERRINAHEHYRFSGVPGVPVHFIRARGRGPDPMPLVLTHGWPWTFWDWSAVIGPLSDPAAHGGDERDAFDVIVPSLPGFPLSNPLTAPDVHVERIADIWVELLAALGHERFGAAGGDWGGIVSGNLGARYPERLTGVYLSLPPIRHVDKAGISADDYAEDERDWPDWNRRCRPTIEGHLAVHRHGHRTLAWALADSPAGLAAWLLERRRNWSDCGGDLESRYTRDFLLTNVSLYWLTDSVGSAMRLYAADHRHNSRPGAHPYPRIEVPTGIGVYPGDIARLPRAVCERAVNLRHWRVLPEGGHFAPAEVPSIYVEELREFFRPLR
jgi:pimeloyl-ACP methyl ester carboxylesterase